jgi:prepilin-type N-terminal cleavage/methylation domain-containing protein
LRYLKSGNTDRGFTLVEVLVALSAMAVGFVILWGMHFSSLKMQKTDQQRAEALRLAKAELEDERDNKTAIAGCNSTTLSAEDRKRFVSCTVCTNWPTSWQRQVTTRVTWQERISLVGGGSTANKRSQSLQLSTIYIDH